MNKKSLPILPLRGVVIFPGSVVPIVVGRAKSINSLLNASNDDILITSQKNANSKDIQEDDLYKIGVIAKIIKKKKADNGNFNIIVEVKNRVKLSNIKITDFIESNYEYISPIKTEQNSLNLELKSLVAIFFEYIKNNDKKIEEDFRVLINSTIDPDEIMNIISSHLIYNAKQSILEELDLLKRAKILTKTITEENIAFEVKQNVQEKVKKQIEKSQKEFFLNEQIKALQKELKTEDNSPVNEIKSKIHDLKLSKEAKEKINSEIKKLELMSPASSEFSVIKNYLDLILGLPWGKKSKNKIDINKSQEVLDVNHYGLNKVKERIIEYISVLKRSSKMKGPILCLIGPPGVGKTSLVKSIAKSINREYTKFSLGGLKDEAEIRGHRKTYIGSMPGKIIDLVKKSKVDNPVMLLDEIDKMSSDFRGDPASALLEVLDLEQNSCFTDHYLEVGYDLSNVIFIATANSYNIPRALIDRMEIIDISGYTEKEKLNIAKKYLLKKQLDEHRIKEGELTINDEAILELIRYYTRESGVRSLERNIATIARKSLTRILRDDSVKSIEIGTINIEDFLGARKYKFNRIQDKDKIGITTGLAYTEVGGDLLSIEAVTFEGDGKIKCTGKLGEVMKESVQAAYSCFLSRATSLGLKGQDYKKSDIHLHVPEGATPKDGPSAGIAIYTTIVSLMTSRYVDKNIAMTGEITLCGEVLPIGGLKEKLLAASRGGIKKVLIPEDNIKDVKEIPSDIKNSLEIITVKNIDQVLDHALIG